MSDHTIRLSRAPSINGLTLAQQMIASCTGAFITASFMTPFDVVKVRLQAQQRTLLKQRCFLYCNGLMDHLCKCMAVVNGNTKNLPWYNRPVPSQLNGTVDAFIKISRNEGLRSLWSGLSPTLIVAIPNTIVYLTSYEQILLYVRKLYYPQDQPVWAGGLAGGLGRSWAVTLFSPLELLRTMIQAQSVSYREVFGLLCKEVNRIGVTSLWRGWVPTILRDVPFSVLYWMMYENMKESFNQRHPSVSFSLLAGALSGGLAGMVTLPLDVVKTHQQMKIGELELFSENNGGVPNSTRNILVHIYRQRGVAGLFTGLVPRLAKVVPACGIMIASYEYAKSYFRQKNLGSVLHPR